MNTLAWIGAVTTAALFIYHHFVYPKLLTWLAKHNRIAPQSQSNLANQPDIQVIIAAYNEQAHIVAKLDNLACQLYPKQKLTVLLGCDGCNDDTATLAKQYAAKHGSELSLEVFEYTDNRGKVAVLNDLILLAKKRSAKQSLLVFSDVSALLSIDCLDICAKHFADSKLGALSGFYQYLQQDESEHQQYWQYQNRIKQAESDLGVVIGMPGAFYSMRTELAEPLTPDSINDDLLLPSLAISKGYRCMLDEDIRIVEAQPDDNQTDQSRRVRIGAGNLQQALALSGLYHPTQGWACFNFISGKALRAFMPSIIAFGLISLTWLSWPLGLLALLLVVASQFQCLQPLFKPITALSQLSFLFRSYLANGYGQILWLLGCYDQAWRANDSNSDSESLPITVKLTKRLVDIVGASVLLVLTWPIILLAAIAIRIESQGSPLFSQLRVGVASGEKVSLFVMYKLRSMVVNAEAKTGAVWAGKQDSNITTVGRFIRKTRIDELPQLWNVLKGDMSLIGPRPERPIFYKKLEVQIPLFENRTTGVKPGISGWAQVYNGYDETIEDARAKAGWDHAYRLALSSFAGWLKTDLDIVVQTIKVVALGRGR